MPIHHTQKAKYQRLKDSGLTAEELKAEIIANQPEDATKQVPLIEIDQFIAELYKTADTTGDLSGSNPPPPAPPVDQPPIAPPAVPPVATVDVVAQFDYKNLTGDEYKRYVAHVESLPLFDLRQYDCYKARQVKKERFEGMPGSPWDVVGIEITTDKPLHTTKIDRKTADEMNKQLPNSGRIYLLKQ